MLKRRRSPLTDPVTTGTTRSVRTTANTGTTGNPTSKAPPTRDLPPNGQQLPESNTARSIRQTRRLTEKNLQQSNNPDAVTAGATCSVRTRSNARTAGTPTSEAPPTRDPTSDDLQLPADSTRRSSRQAQVRRTSDIQQFDKESHWPASNKTKLTVQALYGYDKGEKKYALSFTELPKQYFWVLKEHIQDVPSDWWKAARTQGPVSWDSGIKKYRSVQGGKLDGKQSALTIGNSNDMVPYQGIKNLMCYTFAYCNVIGSDLSKEQLTFLHKERRSAQNLRQITNEQPYKWRMKKPVQWQGAPRTAGHMLVSFEEGHTDGLTVLPNGDMRFYTSDPDLSVHVLTQDAEYLKQRFCSNKPYQVVLLVPRYEPKSKEHKSRAKKRKQLARKYRQRARKRMANAQPTPQESLLTELNELETTCVHISRRKVHLQCEINTLRQLLLRSVDNY